MNVTTVLEEKLVLFITSEKLVLFTGNCLTISHTFLALSTQWLVLLLQGNGDVESSHNFIELFCIWCEYRELGREGKGGGRGGGSGFSCVTPLVETFYDRVTFRIPSNISDGAPLQKQSTISYKLHYNTLL